MTNMPLKLKKLQKDRNTPQTKQRKIDPLETITVIFFWLYNELYQQHISLQQTKTLPSFYNQKSTVHYIVTNKKFAIPL